MERTRVRLLTALVVVALFRGALPSSDSRAAEPRLVKQDFAVDPAWDGFRNRLIADEPHFTRQDFGYRRTNFAGGKTPGEIGGFVQRSATPAWYAKAIEPRTLDDHLTASGKLAVREAQGSSGVLFGWFNESSRGWRTPNSLGVRVDGNGGKYWVFYEYGTKTWETGGGGAFDGQQYQRTRTIPFKADGSMHAWSIDYDPAGHGGDGLITFRIDDRTYTVALGKGHRAAGATFDRFGIWNVQTSGKGAELYLDDLVVNGRRESFDDDPRWEAVGNEAEFAEQVYRPLQNFGYSATSHAGGAAGEIGGIVFRDEKPAYYGAAVGPFTLADEFNASGTLAFVRASSDSGAYFGFFNAASKQANAAAESSARQRNYLAILLEGPSRVGHYVRPGFGAADGRGVTGGTSEGWPVLRPDGLVHRWTLHYRPKGEAGMIEMTLDDRAYSLELAPDLVKAGATFDRLGIFNMQSGGQFVEIYLDDLSYTKR